MALRYGDNVREWCESTMSTTMFGGRGGGGDMLLNVAASTPRDVALSRKQLAPPYYVPPRRLPSARFCLQRKFRAKMAATAARRRL